MPSNNKVAVTTTESNDSVYPTRSFQKRVPLQAEAFQQLKTGRHEFLSTFTATNEGEENKYPLNVSGFEHHSFASPPSLYQTCLNSIYSLATFLSNNDVRDGVVLPSPPSQDIKVDDFDFLEFSRKLAEAAYESSVEPLLVGDKSKPERIEPWLYVRGERGYLDKFCQGRVLPGSVSIWQHHTSAAITCVAKVPTMPDGSKEKELLTVIFKGTGLLGMSARDLSTSAGVEVESDRSTAAAARGESRSTDFWGSNGKKIGRVDKEHYRSYNLFRRQDASSKSFLSVYTEEPVEKLSTITVPPSTSYLGGGVVEYIKREAVELGTKELLIVGHSLGGSMAQICAADMLLGTERALDKVTLVTFGSPLGHRMMDDKDSLYHQRCTHYRLNNAAAADFASTENFLNFVNVAK